MIDARSIRERMVSKAMVQRIQSMGQHVQQYIASMEPVVIVNMSNIEPMRMWDREHGMSYCLSNRMRRKDHACMRFGILGVGYGRHGAKKPRYKNHRNIGRKMWAAL